MHTRGSFWDTGLNVTLGWLLSKLDPGMMGGSSPSLEEWESTLGCGTSNFPSAPCLGWDQTTNSQFSPESGSMFVLASRKGLKLKTWKLQVDSVVSSGWARSIWDHTPEWGCRGELSIGEIGTGVTSKLWFGQCPFIRRLLKENPNAQYFFFPHRKMKV